MKIVGTQGPGIYLVETEDGAGFVADTNKEIRYPVQLLDAILKFGYWEPCEGTPEILEEIQALELEHYNPRRAALLAVSKMLMESDKSDDSFDLLPRNDLKYAAEILRAVALNSSRRDPVEKRGRPAKLPTGWALMDIYEDYRHGKWSSRSELNKYLEANYPAASKTIRKDLVTRIIEGRIEYPFL